MAHKGPLESSNHYTSNRQPSTWQLHIFDSLSLPCAHTLTHTPAHALLLSLMYVLPLSRFHLFPLLPFHPVLCMCGYRLTCHLSSFVSLSLSTAVVTSLRCRQSMSGSINRFETAGWGALRRAIRSNHGEYVKRFSVHGNSRHRTRPASTYDVDWREKEAAVEVKKIKA